MSWAERYLELLSGYKVEQLKQAVEEEENKDLRCELQGEALEEKVKSLMAVMATHAVALTFVKGLELLVRRIRDGSEDNRRRQSSNLPSGNPNDSDSRHPSGDSGKLPLSK